MLKERKEMFVFYEQMLSIMWNEVETPHVIGRIFLDQTKDACA